MFYPRILTITPPNTLTPDERDEYINATVASFISREPGYCEKFTPSLRNIGSGYELIYFSSSKAEISAATKAKVDTTAKEVQAKVDTVATPNTGATRLDVAKGHSARA